MTLTKQPFRKYNLESKEKRTVRSVSLNDSELLQLQEDKKVLNQKKDSTALKTLAEIGHIVIHEPKIRAIINILFKNKKNNKLAGIVEFED